MSHHTYDHKNIHVGIGYDRVLDYVFCNIYDGDDLLYSNLDDEHAGTFQQDVDYYRPILKQFGIEVPETLFVETKRDQENCTGNRNLHYRG